MNRLKDTIETNKEINVVTVVTVVGLQDPKYQ
jgi:hypothetical protein